MTMQTKRSLLAMVFVGLLVGPAIYRRLSAPDNAPRQAAVAQRPEELLRRYGFLLRESSERAGIAFVHQPPRVDSRLEHIAPQIAAMGASLAVVDFDTISDVKTVERSSPQPDAKARRRKGKRRRLPLI